MSEGKPTKAKWWNRPRSPVAPGDTGAVSSEGVRIPEAEAEGDFELQRPLGGGDPTAPGVDADGDFELERPLGGGESAGLGADGHAAPARSDADGHAASARSGADGHGESAESGAGADGDFELADPVPAHREGEPDGISAGHPAALPDDHSSEVPAAFPPDLPSDRPAVLPSTLLPDRPAAFPPDLPLDPPAVLPPGLPPGRPSDPPSNAVPADQAPADRPKPLHDPDPYSTPPYGEPGPWASAPPVQHPAGTPAHGTQVPAAPPAPTTAADDTYEPFAPAPTSVVPAPWQNYDPWAAPAAPGPLQQNGAVVATKAQQRKRTKKALVAGAVLIALVSGGVGGAVGVYLERNGGVSDVELPQAGKEAPGRAPDSVAGIAAQALPSVVTLHVSGSEQEGTGTGFVLDGQGHILTNNHVVEPAADGGEITVTFSSGDTAKAKVVGRDSGYDLAVVEVSGVSGLDPMPLGNSDNVQVGDPVVAIGAPFDLANTVTSGIISAKERPITAGGEGGDGSDVSYVDALQTDAPINPGNSGGPLLDSRARVIGINSAIRSADSGSGLESGQAGSIGLGFAIPINQGKRVAEEIINTGKATHPVIGVTLDMEYAGDGAKVGTQSGDGGPAVTAGGPGAKAGIKEGDIITEVDDRRVHSGEELIVRIRAHHPGDTLRLTLLRGGTEEQLTLVLGSADSN
ncbi:trypsin-like peptidase domain-containing protein [Streptomyces sp. NPDC093544]|uniref:S1C family serine protease n=1 Tax=Streptomyces sp. NPDC093544 TaxID=3155200 RepID=UPI00344AED2A